MALRIPDYAHFLDQMKAVEKKAELFAFLLFDQRQAHAPAAEFARQNYGWFDHLADAASMYVFLPICEAGIAKENPSLRIAQELGLSPDELPCFAFFSKYKDRRPVVFPLDPTVFKDNEKASKLVAALFSVAQTAQTDRKEKEELLASLARHLTDYKRKEKIKDLTSWMLAVPRELATLPKTFVEAFAKALGEQVGKKAMG